MITKNMIVLDIVEKYPETENVFHEYDIILGKCLLCHCLFDSIEDIAIDCNLNINDIINKLNNILKLKNVNKN